MQVDAYDAVVTGAGRGLGRAVALGLALEGAGVWICSDDTEEIERTASLIGERGGEAHPATVDLADATACSTFAETVLRDAEKLRVVVNNAATLTLTPVLDLTLSEWSRTLAVNLTAPLLLTRAFLPTLSTTGGSIVNVSSEAGIAPFEKEAAYCASKYGVEALSACLALELQDTAVSVNTITPGLHIKPTSITERQWHDVPAGERSQWSDPMEITPAFNFLASLRGEVRGRRFNALRLTQALEHHGKEGTLARIAELAE